MPQSLERLETTKIDLRISKAYCKGQNTRSDFTYMILHTCNIIACILVIHTKLPLYDFTHVTFEKQDGALLLCKIIYDFCFQPIRMRISYLEGKNTACLNENFIDIAAGTSH